MLFAINSDATVRMVRAIVLLASLASSATLAACAADDPAIRFLRSETHTFSRAERRLITQVASSATKEIRTLLPGLPATIQLTVRPGTDVIPETGEVADAMPPAGVMWTVDPARPGGVDAVTREWLRATLFHEYHHLVRSAHGVPQTIVERAMFEGLATVFERAAGVRAPWGEYPSNVHEWAAELRQLPPDASTRQWIHAHPDGRRWIGMRVGAYWADRAIAASGRSAADLVDVSTVELLRLAQSQ